MKFEKDRCNLSKLAPGVKQLIWEEAGYLDSHSLNWLVGISDNDNMMDWQDFIFLQDWEILIPLGNKRKLFTE